MNKQPVLDVILERLVNLMESVPSDLHINEELRGNIYREVDHLSSFLNYFQLKKGFVIDLENILGLLYSVENRKFLPNKTNTLLRTKILNLKSNLDRGTSNNRFLFDTCAVGLTKEDLVYLQRDLNVIPSSQYLTEDGTLVLYSVNLIESFLNNAQPITSDTLIY